MHSNWHRAGLRTFRVPRPERHLCGVACSGAALGEVAGDSDQDDSVSADGNVDDSGASNSDIGGGNVSDFGIDDSGASDSDTGGGNASDVGIGDDGDLLKLSPGFLAPRGQPQCGRSLNGQDIVSSSTARLQMLLFVAYFYVARSFASRLMSNRAEE